MSSDSKNEPTDDFIQALVLDFIKLNLTDRHMKDLAPEEKAKCAIKIVLNKIKENPEVACHIGFGSQAYSVLTEAAASLWNEPLIEVRNHYRIKKHPLELSNSQL